MVGVGASAGGLRALEAFLGAVSPSGIAYVVVQHLSPEHASILPQLLGAACRLPVEPVTDGTTPQPDRVYVIPPNAALLYRDGKLRLEPPAPRASRLPISALFASLAEALGSRSVGVVLSGTGSDGASGIQALKRSGGLTLAQSPAEAEYDAMPRAALATGDLDFVLLAAEMPAIIARELERRAAELASRPPPEHDEDPLDGVARVVTERTGHELGAYKRTTLRRRIQRRMDALRIARIADYQRRVEQDAGEAETLVSEMLIGVTRFFRDPEAFAALDRHVTPALLRRATADEPLRVWIPGCATGEEAYSLAILLHEEARRGGRKPPVLQVFATDLDEAALGVARRGRYPPSVARDVPEDLLRAYFIEADGAYEVVKEVRDGLIFSLHDVLVDPPFSRLDLISCRNLLIYFHPETQQRLIPIFHYALRPGGFLFLGSAEMVDERSDLLEAVDSRHRIYSRRQVDRRPPLPLPMGTSAAARRLAPPRRRDGGPRVEASLAQAALLGVLDDPERSAALALVNAKGEARYFAGPITKFLDPPPGAPTSDLLTLSPPGLRAELSAALEAARAGDGETRRVVTGPSGGGAGRLELVVRPVTGQRELLLVLFRQLADAGDGGGAATSAGAGEEGRERAAAGWRGAAEPDTTGEQLRAANEELQTMNEELQSANEELQVSQEELQSVNEELHTVNAELSRKVEELDHLNADLRNLFQSTRLATLFLDGQLRIVRFTPPAAELFPVTERDLGRPLADLTSPFGNDVVLRLAREVLEGARVEERIVALADGTAHYLLRALPYERLDGTADGAVVTFVDVSELKRAELALRDSEERFRLLVEGAKDVAIFVLTPAGVVASWNPGAERLKGWRAEEVIGRHFSIFHTAEAVAAGEPARLLERTAREGSVQLEGWRRRKDGGRFWAYVVLTALHDDAGQLRGYSKIVRDITERKRLEEQLVEVDRRKDEFLGVLSHELRNPLAAIRNSLYVLTRAAPDGDRVERNLAVLERQAQQLTRLTDDLLDVTRISRGKVRLRRERVDLVELALRVAEDHRPFFAAAGVDLEVLPGDAPAWVNADPARLSQMMGNLLQNAVKFTSRGGRATLAAERSSDGFATFRVTDTGEGLSPEVLSRLFEPFMQAERALDRGAGGLGLGLALVKGLAELHGGSVTAFSDGPDQGATFVLQLPLDQRKLPRKTPPPPPEPSRLPRRILVVEDNVDAAVTLQEALRMQGHEVELAYSGTEGLEKAIAHAPEVVLCDLGLPGLDGYEVARRIRARPELRGIFLVALSGYAQPEDVERARAAGFDRHLAKPPDLDDLWRAVSVPRGEGERSIADVS